MAWFTEVDLEDLAGGRSFSRGQGYVEAVSNLRDLPDGVVATVRGTDPYQVRLYDADGGLDGEFGDVWGQAATLPMRARLRRYDDLDGALADLDEARTLAGEFGSLSLGDQLYSDLRWIDLHLRRGDTDLAIAMLDSARERALHTSSREMLLLVDAREADLRVRLGDLGRAGDLLDAAEPGLLGDTAFPADHARTLVGSAGRAMSGAG